MRTATLKSGKVIEVGVNQTLLEAALQNGVSWPYSCKTGRCSTCKCKVVRGQTRTLQPEEGLNAQELDAGWVLGCVRTLDTDVQIEVADLGDVALPAIKTLPCRISQLQRVAADVMLVNLRLPPTAEFEFIPGQYIDVIGPNGMRRSYSLANGSFASKQLELHIRLVEGGAFSRFWFNEAKAGDLLRLNGPKGTFFLRDAAGIDLIFLATGTGIAPVKAILESLPYIPMALRPRSTVVLWGSRTHEDLYLDVAAISGEHRYVPVLSRPSAGWSGGRGHVQDVLLASQKHFDNAAIYACGSNVMIHEARDRLVQHGLPTNCFWSDAFVCSSHQ